MIYELQKYSKIKSRVKVVMNYVMRGDVPGVVQGSDSEVTTQGSGMIELVMASPWGHFGM